MHYDYYSDPEEIDIYQLKHLPQFAGMKEWEIKALLHKMHRIEQKQWELEVEATLAKQRKDTIEYIANLEAGKGYKPLPTKPVEITLGVRIDPSLIDDLGFASREDLARLKRTIKMSLDEKKKIYM